MEGEFVPMLKAYHDKETEFNWEPREKSITRLRGILRGNAIEPPYLEVLVQCMKQMVDGIIKGVKCRLSCLSFHKLEQLDLILTLCNPGRKSTYTTGSQGLVID